MHPIFLINLSMQVITSHESNKVENESVNKKEHIAARHREAFWYATNTLG
jgi:hypothetical protein